MKNIKITFESFINEELSPSTYLSAADKLKDKGHNKRAEELRNFSNKNLDDELSKIKPINIIVDDINIEIKPEYFTFDISLNKTEHGSIDINWEIPDLDEDDTYIGQNIYFAYDSENNKIIDGPNIDGLLIDNRQSANKIFKMIKDIINIKVAIQPELELILTKLTVNDLYES